ncbi:hypothetical protein F5X68DRAFT_206612 [Plectosphaerella plurivora]|uniref:2EXR domain-containing protein n=1 Tax=Plectosphaerella plurivora TaxID=936078 RepID=A0A9P8VCD5_9PEZI|nr:hypothetical protein F5X68DRAFT_206612 [Plectosphaerella plurivora]
MPSSVQFPLANLPPELQDEIWTLTLRTTPKIFHVATTTPSPTDPSKHRLTFHHNHPPPTAVLVCRQARAAARRAGFTSIPQPSDAPPIWINARHDILYLDRRTAKRVITYSPEAPQLYLVPALRSLHNIGFEVGTKLPGRIYPVEGFKGSAVRDFMALLVSVLLDIAPHFKELHYLAPWVHESLDESPVQSLDCVITPLDTGTTVYTFGRRGTRSWEEVRPEFVAALDALDLPGGPPVLKAWRLIRQHPLGICRGEIVGRMAALQVGTLLCPPHTQVPDVDRFVT